MARQHQIRLKAFLDDTWPEWLDGLTITHDPAGATLPTGAVRDQTALRGLMAKASHLQLPPIAVAQRPTGTEAAPLAPPVSRSSPDTSGDLTKNPRDYRQWLDVTRMHPYHVEDVLCTA